MSSSRALCCLPSGKRQKHDFYFMLRSVYNKTTIRFGFSDIQSNQCGGKRYDSQLSASADDPYLDLE